MSQPVEILLVVVTAAALIDAGMQHLYALIVLRLRHRGLDFVDTEGRPGPEARRRLIPPLAIAAAGLAAKLFFRAARRLEIARWQHLINAGTPAWGFESPTGLAATSRPLPARQHGGQRV